MGSITVVFNNIRGDKRLKTGWGSSILVEQGKESILFDTGPDAEDLFFNLDTLGIDIRKIRKIALSHPHQDHFGGLKNILLKNPENLEVYATVRTSRRIPKSLRVLAKNIYAVEEKKEMASHIYLSAVEGPFSEEGVLVIDSPRGLIVVTGCAHPGIYRICGKIKADFGRRIYAVMGGFHLEHHLIFFVKSLGTRLKDLGIEIIAPNHCTGQKQTEALQQAFKDGFLSFAVGKTFLF